MNKIFIVYGLGNHFKKKIYPALRKFKNVFITDIKTSKNINIKRKYLNRLSKNSLPNSAYIATPISTHYDYLKELANNNTIKYIFCEKTLTEKYYKTKKIIDLYKSKNKFLIETYMYIYHPEFLYLKKFIIQNKIKNAKGLVFCRYTIPKLNKSNHRNNELLTGGELYEIGCYPINTSIFFI
jgi:Predicted dehydrogenases and related proteins